MAILTISAACTAFDPSKVPSIDTTYCDPYERKDCWSLSQEVIEKLAKVADENDRLKAALKVCERGRM